MEVMVELRSFSCDLSRQSHIPLRAMQTRGLVNHEIPVLNVDNEPLNYVLVRM
jgi:hypothetical protein